MLLIGLSVFQAIERRLVAVSRPSNSVHYEELNGGFTADSSHSPGDTISDCY
jgi:hypothetical protein